MCEQVQVCVRTAHAASGHLRNDGNKYACKAVCRTEFLIGPIRFDSGSGCRITVLLRFNPLGKNNFSNWFGSVETHRIIFPKLLFLLFGNQCEILTMFFTYLQVHLHYTYSLLSQIKSSTKTHGVRRSRYLETYPRVSRAESETNVVQMRRSLRNY